MGKRGWHPSEEKFLIENYATMTINELAEGLQKLSGLLRSDDSINAKIKRLKDERKIEGLRTDDVVFRALTQRRK